MCRFEKIKDYEFYTSSKESDKKQLIINTDIIESFIENDEGEVVILFKDKTILVIANSYQAIKNKLGIVNNS